MYCSLGCFLKVRQLELSWLRACFDFSRHLLAVGVLEKKNVGGKFFRCCRLVGPPIACRVVLQTINLFGYSRSFMPFWLCREGGWV